MSQHIIVRGKGQTVKVTARDDGTVSEHTLRGAFLLKNDVTLGLFKEGVALERRHIDDDYVFKLEGEWDGEEFELRWKNQRNSQRPFKEDELPILEPSQFSTHAERVLTKCSDWVYSIPGENGVGSAVQFEENHILSTAQFNFVLNKDYKFRNNQREIQATCLYINEFFDFSLLKIKEQLPENGFSTGAIRGGDKFVLLGYPENSSHETPSLSEGIVTGINKNGVHFAGTVEVGEGFTSAPVFNRVCQLAGIVIKGQEHFPGTQKTVKILPLNVIMAEVLVETETTDE